MAAGGPRLRTGYTIKSEKLEEDEEEN